MGADIRNCAGCGRMFAYQGRNLCSKCLENEDTDYGVVRRYVRDNPGAGVFQVAEATGVEEEKILQFLKDGRLQSKGFVEITNCERCGKRISEGKFCEQCRGEINQALRSVLPSSSSTLDNNGRDKGMHYKQGEKNKSS
ncbi:MAG TPA: TIGR03826 family flagellar region protein [Syntrophomonadaceae bacterium]|nr:TIGR03826 family flagellar region protein [Syntrophomonadaceae bacterium]